MWKSNQHKLSINQHNHQAKPTNWNLDWKSYFCDFNSEIRVVDLKNWRYIHQVLEIFIGNECRYGIWAFLGDLENKKKQMRNRNSNLNATEMKVESRRLRFGVVRFGASSTKSTWISHSFVLFHLALLCGTILNFNF